MTTCRFCARASQGLNDTVRPPPDSETERLKSALESRERAVRLYSVLSRVNEAIVRCREEQELHRQVCRILVEEGGYALAWIGQPQGDRVVPTVASGASAEYVREITVAIDGEFGRGPTGTSIREGRAVVNQDFLANAAMGPWRDRAIHHGFRSSAAFPLRRNGTVIASLTLYAREASAFDDEHIRLLEALAADVSYAHDALEDERLRSLAEESLARSEAKLREAAERKNEFLAILSHELRNPLAPITNGLHVLEHAPAGGEQALRAQAVVKRQVRQLSRLVDDLLDITRVARGKLRTERVRVELTEIVRQSAEDHRPMFATARIEFAVALAPGPIWILGDSVRLAQIVGNLLTNAAKYTPGGGKVFLSVGEAPAGTATIQVRDTGVGISADLLGQVFEPFLQVESTLERSRGGLGLGLALVKGLVDAHGGSVEARSEGAGLGAEFTVTLPIDVGPTPATDESVPGRSPLGPRRVLVIDDNVDVAMSVQDMLMLAGHEVEVAYNGSDGIDKARLFQPDIVICDIEMSGMHGHQVVTAFRSDPLLRSKFLVAHSGHARSEDVERAMALGFDAYIRKPASIAEIERVLAQSNGSRQPLVQAAASVVLDPSRLEQSREPGHSTPAGNACPPPTVDPCTALRQHLRQKGHDLSTPLATLSLSLQAALTRLQRGEAIREETVRTALRQVDRIADLMRELMLVSRS
jgi:signal transduction histidine kinase/DNA-binding NarL/FixJ family response regulator